MLLTVGLAWELRVGNSEYASSLPRGSYLSNTLEDSTMAGPDELVTRIRAAREQYLRSVLEWRRERDASEAKLRAAEHELARSLAQLFCVPEVTELRAG